MRILHNSSKLSVFRSMFVRSSGGSPIGHQRQRDFRFRFRDCTANYRNNWTPASSLPAEFQIRARAEAYLENTISPLALGKCFPLPGTGRQRLVIDQSTVN